MTVSCVSPEQFRAGMRLLGASVCVITAADGVGQSGLTATAVCSLSPQPPSLLISVNRSSRTCGFIQQTGMLAVNLLAENQAAISDCFSQSGVDQDQFKLAGTWTKHALGPPVLDDAAAWFVCEIGDHMLTQTHAVLEARLRACEVRNTASPLIYAKQAYHKL